MENPFSPALEAILDSLRASCREESRADLNYITEEAEHLIKHGEPKVALENMCEHLFEMQIRITCRTFEAIKDLAQKMSVPERRYSFLADLLGTPDE